MPEDNAYEIAQRRINEALLQKLKSLSLDYDRLIALPPEIGQLTALENLSLDGNQLTALPPEIGQLMALENLSLDGNQLTALPPEIGQLTALQSLSLDGNQLTTLPAEIGQLTALESLSLHGNQLTVLPPEIGQLTALQSLSLDGNQLTALPAEIGQLTALGRLSLDGNQLTALPPGIGQLRKLQASAEIDSEPFTEGLFIADNPFPDPLPILIGSGQPSATTNVLAWLRGELDLDTLPALSDAERTPERHEPPISPPDIPPQGHGPHFDTDDNGVITFAPAEALDREGNNVARLRRLHPSLRALAKNLKAGLGTGNIPHWHLGERAAAYAELIDQNLDVIDFSLLYVEGVRLANAEKAATEKATAAELPALDAHVREAIDSLLHLHGTFMLATAEGIELIANEELYQRTRQEETEYREAAVEFARSFQNRPEIIDPRAASFVLGASQEIGQGANPGRSDAIATGTIKNVAITVSTAATLAALSAGAVASGSAAVIVGAGATVLVVGEGLKKSKPFAATAALVTNGLNQASETEIAKALMIIRDRSLPQLRLILAIEPQLRRLAGQNRGFDWLIRSLEWIKKQQIDPE